MPEEEKATLTQRRAITSGVAKLDKNKLGMLGQTSKEAEKGSAAKVVIWVLIVIVLAVAAYFSVRAFLNNQTPSNDDNNQQTTPTPSPTVDPTDLILSPEILADTEAAGLQADSKFKTTDQAVGEASETAYTIDKFTVQQFETFIRLSFDVTADGNKPFPETSAIFDETSKNLTLTMNNVLEDKSALVAGGVAIIPTSVIDSITHETPANSSESYLIALQEKTGFVLHTLTDGSIRQVVLDIKELDENTANPTGTPSTTVEGTPTPSPTPTEVTGEQLTNEYSSADQVISTLTTGNTVKISKYNYGDSSAYFNYNLFLVGGDKPYPNVTSKVEDKKITFTISNLSADNIVGNGGSGSTNFAAKGVRDVSTVNIKNSANKSTYEFILTKNVEYRMLIDEENKLLRIEFKH